LQKFYILGLFVDSESAQKIHSRSLLAGPAVFRFITGEGLIGLFELHSAAAVAGSVADRVAGAAAATVAEIHSGPFQTDSFDWFAATAFAWVVGVDRALTTLRTAAEQSLIPFDLDHMPPDHRLSAATIARLLAHAVAVTAIAAGASIKDIGPDISLSSRAHTGFQVSAAGLALIHHHFLTPLTATLLVLVMLTHHRAAGCQQADGNQG